MAVGDGSIAFALGDTLGFTFGAALEVGDALVVVVGADSTVGAGFWVTRTCGDKGASVPVDFTLNSGAALADS